MKEEETEMNLKHKKYQKYEQIKEKSDEKRIEMVWKKQKHIKQIRYKE